MGMARIISPILEFGAIAFWTVEYKYWNVETGNFVSLLVVCSSLNIVEFQPDSIDTLKK